MFRRSLMLCVALGLGCCALSAMDSSTPLPVEQTDDDDHPTACQDGFEVCLDESEEE